LPGDSLLFVLGAFAAQGVFHPMLLAGILILAAVSGDSANYAVGKYLGDRIVHSRKVRFFNKDNLDKAHRFYEKYGGKTIVLARFVPVIRTFAPFVAGIAHMEYIKFFIYNVTGGILWVALFVFGGFYFGNIPIVKEHFSLVTIFIIVISIMPAIVEYYRSRSKAG
jgi:membrane-associated protein